MLPVVRFQVWKRARDAVCTQFDDRSLGLVELVLAYYYPTAARDRYISGPLRQTRSNIEGAIRGKT
ncbi:hypothetical protein LMG27198_34040 [Methylocystis echinoides]|uniref:Uncharacterized protein n=1 Tax=Methylocystis echinoides TaxID=29468 RepID=A0A9W6GWQ0_9HYPH|nr:hypothetical protein LMG27198_34040 [Methylocystis echinoides]